MNLIVCWRANAHTVACKHVDGRDRPRIHTPPNKRICICNLISKAVTTHSSGPFLSVFIKGVGGAEVRHGVFLETIKTEKNAWEDKCPVCVA